MKWESLLCEERSFWPLDLEVDERPKNDDILDVFQIDSSRITNSAPYHRLQRKTQVLPFPKTDYPRSRLTHTNEVADCGRELARIVGRSMVDRAVVTPIQAMQMEDIVSAACKAHDIGNPPFGHSGEYAIQHWVQKNVGIEKTAHDLRFEISERKYRELCNFDGNGQGFRVITQTSGWRRKGGLQLTFAVLSAFSKYPWSVDHITSKKKYSVPIGSEGIAKEAFSRTGLRCIEEDGYSFKYVRHPLAYLVEAADDISYITSDLEDAANADVADHDQVVVFLQSIAEDAIRDSYDRSQFLRRETKLAKDDKKALRRYLKDHAQRALKIAATDSFLENYDKIMEGNFSGSLFDESRVASQLRKVSDYFRTSIYDNVGKIKNEVFGATVVSGLLDFYFTALFEAKRQIVEGKSLTPGNDCIDEIVRRNLITFPLDNYIGDADLKIVAGRLASSDADDLAQMAIDYVSGMTDPYASQVYQQILGSERPAVNW